MNRRIPSQQSSQHASGSGRRDGYAIKSTSLHVRPFTPSSFRLIGTNTRPHSCRRAGEGYCCYVRCVNVHLKAIFGLCSAHPRARRERKQRRDGPALLLPFRCRRRRPSFTSAAHPLLLLSQLPVLVSFRRWCPRDRTVSALFCSVAVLAAGQRGILLARASRGGEVVVALSECALRVQPNLPSIACSA